MKTGCVDELRQLLSRKGIHEDALRGEAERILARMESRNCGGVLDAFIQDNRDSVLLAIKGRDAA